MDRPKTERVRQHKCRVNMDEVDRLCHEQGIGMKGLIERVRDLSKQKFSMKTVARIKQGEITHFAAWIAQALSVSLEQIDLDQKHRLGWRQLEDLLKLEFVVGYAAGVVRKGLDELLTRCIGTVDPILIAAVLSARCRYQIIAGENGSAVTTLKSLDQHIESHNLGNHWPAIWRREAVATSFFNGDDAEVIRLTNGILQKAVQHAEIDWPASDRWLSVEPIVVCLCYRSLALWRSGCGSDAIETNEYALKRARAYCQPTPSENRVQTLAVALAMHAWLCQMQAVGEEDPDHLAMHLKHCGNACSELRCLCEDLMGLYGRIAKLLGQWVEAIQYESNCNFSVDPWWDETGANQLKHYWHLLSIDIAIRRGDTRTAKEIATQQLYECEKHDRKLWISEFRRVLKSLDRRSS